MRVIVWTSIWAALILGGLFVFGASQGLASVYRECGIASWYTYSGRPTADGERFPTREATVAHKTLPFGTIITITDQATGRSIRARVNDRGPFVRGRIVDLSPAARRAFGGGGLWRVCIHAEMSIG